MTQEISNYGREKKRDDNRIFGYNPETGEVREINFYGEILVSAFEKAVNRAYQETQRKNQD